MFNLTSSAKRVAPALALLATAVSFPTHASVTPDSTRLVFNEGDKSISVTLRNNDPKQPYLAQSWIEDEKGNKISSPLAVLPPVQRIDAMMNGQVKVQGMPDINNCRPTVRACSILTCVKFRQNQINLIRCRLRCRRVSNCSGDPRRWRTLA